MIEPYRMIVVNAILLSLIILGALTYYYIFPRKKIKPFTLLLILSVLPIISILRTGVYESGDFNLHIYRAISFYDAIRDGQLLPSWAGNLNNTFGYPLFVFLNPFPYYIIIFFHLLGLSFIASMKAFLITSYILSGVFMYIFSRKLFKNNLSALIVSVFYLFGPYHLIDLHFKVALGETLAFVILPLYFYTILLLLERQKAFRIIWLASTFALLVFAHQAIALFSFIIVVPFISYSLYKKSLGKIKLAISLLISLSLGAIMSLYVWLPHIILIQFTHANILQKISVSFPAISDLLFSRWRYGFLFQGPRGELSSLIGYPQILIVITLIIILLTRPRLIKKNYYEVVFWTAIFLILFFMLTPLSNFLWSSVPILSTAQFSTRLMIFVVFVSSILAGYFSLIFNRKRYIIIILIVITLGYTMLNWGHRRLIPEITDYTLRLQLPQSTISGEGFTFIGTPRWVDVDAPWQINLPNTPIKILDGSGSIKELSRKTTLHQYSSISSTPLIVIENTYYFPGWTVTIDGESIPIDYETPPIFGTINFVIPAGEHSIDVSYKDPPLLRFMKTVSLTLIFIIILSIITRYFFIHITYRLFTK